MCKPFYNQSVNSKAFKHTIITLKFKIYFSWKSWKHNFVCKLLLHFSHTATALLAQDTFSHWSWWWVMSFDVKLYFIWNHETWTCSGNFIVRFYQRNSAQQKDFWSPFGFVHNWCNCQRYTNPRLSTFMIKLQYHFLPLKLGFRSDKAQSTKSTPPIHLLYALMASGCNTITLPLPHLHCFTFPTGSTLTALLPTDTTLLSFHRINSIWWPDVKYWYSPLSIFLNSLIHFNVQQSVLSAQKVPVALKLFSERVFMSWYNEKL